MFLARGFPPTPTPQKFGVSLIKLDSFNVRIYGERGYAVKDFYRCKLGTVAPLGVADVARLQVVASRLPEFWRIQLPKVLNGVAPLPINSDERVCHFHQAKPEFVGSRGPGGPGGEGGNLLL